MQCNYFEIQKFIYQDKINLFTYSIYLIQTVSEDKLKDDKGVWLDS